MSTTRDNINLTRDAILLEALHHAQRIIDELNTDQATGERDDNFGGDKQLEELYYKLNSMCLSISERNNFWWNK